ncbi:MAG: beta-galactosidase, partial [Armatimonadetes bacterium]|nr:beta-galactosidase [Armatimonadota bacterium]
AQYGITPETYTRGHFPETPHINWATPLAGGPVRAIVMAFSENMRDVVELAQRMDLDYVPVQHFSYRRPKALGGLMCEQIERALPDSDVMVVGGFYWSALPDELLDAIRARVRAGMGLVVVSPGGKWDGPIEDILTENPLDGDQGLLDLVPVATLPEYHAPRDSHLHLGTYGQGRVCRLTWQEFTRPGHSLLPDFRLEDIDDDANCPIEYTWAALAKVIAWAAQRDTDRITAVSAQPGEATVNIAPGEGAATLELVTLDRYFDDPDVQRVDVPAAGGDFRFKLRPRINGTTHLRVWLRDAKKRVIDFGAAAFEQTRGPDITAVELDRPVYAAGDEIHATVRLTGDVNGLTLRGRLVDTWGRLLAPVTEVKPGARQSVKLAVPCEHPITLAANLWVSLSDGEQTLDRELTRVWLDRPEDREEFTVCAWYAWDFMPHAYWGLQWVRDWGVDTYVSLGGEWRARNAAYADIRHGPENVERVYPRNTDDSLVRVPCLSDPEYRAKVEQRVRSYAASVRPYGVLEWSLGDESTLGRRDYCHSPTCLAAFRDFLKQMYPDLAALNESWGSDFGSWDEVVPATLDEVKGHERLGAWLDHRRYMERLFTDYHAWLRDMIVDEIPDARVGISGTPRPNSYSGHDWWQLMQHALDHLSGYGGVQRELQRSFLRPGTFYSTFLGYDYKDNNEQRARYGPWDLLLHGANGINYYTLMSNTLNCPLVHPDGSPARHAQWFLEEVAELKAGTGRLIMLGDYQHDGIAVHYSPPSIHGATATGLFDYRDRLRNYQTNLTNIGKVLQECHYQYNFIHEEQMRNGELSDYRVLIMPWSSCVSEAEARVIEEFVRGGGTLIADSFCGVRDGHGAPRAMLDDIFGVRQPLDAPELAPAELTVGGDVPASLRGLEELGAVPVASGASGVEPAGATALGRVGDMPALFVNRVGKGAAILLNCSFSNYSDVRATGAAGETEEEIKSPEQVTRPIRNLMRALLSAAGVHNPLEIEVDGGAGPQIQVSRFTLGDGMLIGAVRAITAGPIDRDDLLGYRVGLPEAAHVYDVRAGKYLGEVAEVTDSAPRGIARLWAVLPYRVTGLSLAGPSRATAGDVVRLNITLTAAGGKPGPHVVRVTVTGPDGQERRYHARNVTVWGGEAHTEFPLACDAAAGEWTVAARDVISGETAAHKVTVAER